jgi:DNA-binding winged helix-turn-helix (wHTH) protein
MVCVSGHPILGSATKESPSNDRALEPSLFDDPAGEAFIAREGDILALMSQAFSDRTALRKVSPGMVSCHDVGRTLRFGPFELSVIKRVLRRHGVALPLGSRAFDILVYLVERPGEIIPKRELIDHVWADVTVEEGNLRVHVVAIRKALGDGQFGDRYIANVRGRGYAFTGSVIRLDGPEDIGDRTRETLDCVACSFRRTPIARWGSAPVPATAVSFNIVANIRGTDAVKC